MSRRSANWHPAWGGPVSTGQYKVQPDHFKVTELKQLTLTDQGEHLWLWVEKININTLAVVQQLSRELGIAARSIGYAGRKDRQAICRQWFSVPMHGTIDTEKQFDNFVILEQRRHDKKLRIGDLAGNHFQIILTSLDTDRAAFENRLEKISHSGFPNYFGVQRFGRGFQNLSRGQRMLTGRLRVRERNQRSIYLSACRSYLFNELLASRVNDGTWNRLLNGDIQVTDTDYLDGTFQETPEYPLGWLPGDGDIPIKAESAELLMKLLEPHQELFTGIQNSRTAWQARPLVMLPRQLDYTWHGNALELDFALPAGAFATSLIRELIRIDE